MVFLDILLRYIRLLEMICYFESYYRWENDRDGVVFILEDFHGDCDYLLTVELNYLLSAESNGRMYVC